MKIYLFLMILAWLILRHKFPVYYSANLWDLWFFFGVIGIFSFKWMYDSFRYRNLEFVLTPDLFASTVYPEEYGSWLIFYLDSFYSPWLNKNEDKILIAHRNSVRKIGNVYFIPAKIEKIDFMEVPFEVVLDKKPKEVYLTVSAYKIDLNEEQILTIATYKEEFKKQNLVLNQLKAILGDKTEIIEKTISHYGRTIDRAKGSIWERIFKGD